MPCTTTNGGTSRSHAGHRGDEGALADADELRDARQPAERHPVLDHHVPRELHPVGQDAVRADDHVVRDVRADHEQVAVADARRAPLGAAVHGDVLAEDVALAALEARRAAGVALGLRLAADDRERVHDVARPERRRPAHHRVRVQHAPFAAGPRPPRRSRRGRPSTSAASSARAVDDGGGVQPRAIVGSPGAVDDAREQLGARAERAVDRRLALELPDVGAVVDDAHLEIEPVARA